MHGCMLIQRTSSLESRHIHPAPPNRLNEVLKPCGWNISACRTFRQAETRNGDVLQDWPVPIPNTPDRCPVHHPPILGFRDNFYIGCRHDTRHLNRLGSWSMVGIYTYIYIYMCRYVPWHHKAVHDFVDDCSNLALVKHCMPSRKLQIHAVHYFM